jgi:hypothetical protein
MPELQEIIHKFEVGEGARIIRWITAILSFIALAVAYDVRESHCFSNPEAMDMAQLARNISEGKGYTTKCIRPLGLHIIKTKQPSLNLWSPRGNPDVSNAPGYPVFLAGLMKVLPFKYEIPRQTTFFRYQPEVLITVINQVLFFCVLLLVYFLGTKLFDAFVGGMTVLTLAGTELLWRFTASGLSTMLVMFLLVLLVWVLVKLEIASREAEHGAGWYIFWAGVAGLLVGLGGLTRYSMAWMIVPVLTFFIVFFSNRRFVMVLTALVVFSGVFAPWVYRNYQLSGHFLGTASLVPFQETTAALSGNRMERSMGKAIQDVSMVELEDLTRKFLMNTGHFVQDELPRLGGNWTSALFLVGLTIPFTRLILSRLRFFLLLSMGVMLVVQAMGRTYLSELAPDTNAENQLILFVPFVFMFGMGLFSLLLDQLEFPFPQANTVISCFALVVASLPIIFTFLPPRSFSVVYPPYYPPLIQQAGGWYREDELMMSDIPWAVAWYGNRPCVWYTQNPSQEFFQINDFQKPIKALYLTQLTLDGHFQSQLVKGDDRPWGRFALEVLLTSKVPTGFPLRTALSVILPEQIFLTDLDRWNVPQK